LFVVTHGHRDGKQFKQPMSTTPDADYWPFDLPQNCAVIAFSTLYGTEPILHVTHDDHGW